MTSEIEIEKNWAELSKMHGQTKKQVVQSEINTKHGNKLCCSASIETHTTPTKK